MINSHKYTWLRAAHPVVRKHFDAYLEEMEQEQKLWLKTNYPEIEEEYIKKYKQ